MSILFTDWQTVVRIVSCAPIVYFAVILIVRLSGKRSTSQMNNFDWIVTVAIGSIVGSTVLLKDIAIADGLAGIAVLMLMQFIVTKLSALYPPVSDAIRATPALLVLRGRFVRDSMKRERIVEGEVEAAIREKGLTNLKEVAAVILENDGRMSVIADAAEGDLPLDAVS